MSSDFYLIFVLCLLFPIDAINVRVNERNWQPEKTVMYDIEMADGHPEHIFVN